MLLKWGLINQLGRHVINVTTMFFMLVLVLVLRKEQLLALERKLCLITPSVLPQHTSLVRSFRLQMQGLRLS